MIIIKSLKYENLQSISHLGHLGIKILYHISFWIAEVH